MKIVKQKKPFKFPLHITILLTILLICISPAIGFAQDDAPPETPTQPYPQDIRFEILSMENGLSNNIVWSILQDSRGFMWFATIDGLNRYDGYKFKVFRHDPEDPHSLSTNPLRVIYEDQTGDLWIGTSGGGLNRLDRYTEKFTHYKHDPDDPHSLSGNDVRSIYEDRNGVLWIGTTAGLNRYDRQTEMFTQFRHDPDDPQSLGHDFVTSVIEDLEGMIWVGTWGGGLDCLDPHTGIFTHYRHDPDDSYSLSNNNVWVMSQEQSGDIWIGTNNGLNKLTTNDVSSGRAHFIRYLNDPDDPLSLSNNKVRSILEDQEGNLWVGTFVGGLNKLDDELDVFFHYTNKPFEQLGLSNNGVISLYEDQVGSLWIGTLGGGVNIIDRNRKPFFHYYNNPNIPQSLSNDAVRSILVDRNGVTWVGTEEGGLNRSNQDSTTQIGEMTFKHYKANPNEPQSLSDNFVWAIDQDLAGILWIGTEAGGLNRFDPLNETFTHYRYQPDQPNGPSSNSIRAVLVDKSGFIWLGHRGSGLDRFDPETETITNFRNSPDDPNSLSANTVRALYEDSTGRLWIGTIDGGLNLFDRATETFINYKNDPSDPSSLSDNSVRAILEDQAGNLWIGTWGGGLNKLDRERGVFKHYREKDGLANDVIWGILEDNVPPQMSGPYLWISTNQGLSRFDPITESFRNYNVLDGLQANSFYSAHAKSHEGLLFFGGSNGFNVFNPNDIVDNPHIPPIVITDFQLLNLPVPIGDDSVLERSITESNELILSHQDRIISFEFAALSYTAPAKNRYRYLLEGFENQWNEIESDRRFATYTNLNPGDYVFWVKGSNNDGVWNEDGTTLHITITPPWWGTWWFRGLLLALLAAAVYLGYQLRVRSYQARSHELEAEVALKTRELQAEISGHEVTEARLRRARDELATLLDVSQDVISTLELEQLLKNFLQQIDRVVGCDAVSIHLLEGSVLKCLTYQYNENINVSPPQILYYEQIPGFPEMLEFQQGFVLADLHAEPALMAAIIEHSEEGFDYIPPSVHSFAAAPMVIRNRGIGMLAISSAHEAIYDQDTLNLLQIFTNQLAVAIENARLYEQAQAAAVVEERNRLARDLHDSTTQALYSALLFSETGKKLTQQGKLEDAAYYQSRVSTVVHEALKEMRLLVFEMRPLILEQEGLVGALQMRLDAVESRSGMEARLYADDLPSLPGEMSEGLYRIAQEALNNALKHAQAENVAVHLDCEHGLLTMQVVDDGQGFDPQAVEQGGGMGLSNMRQRAEQLNGELSINSKPGEGTSIQVHVPLEEIK